MALGGMGWEGWRGEGHSKRAQSGISKTHLTQPKLPSQTTRHLPMAPRDLFFRDSDSSCCTSASHGCSAREEPVFDSMPTPGIGLRCRVRARTAGLARIQSPTRCSAQSGPSRSDMVARSLRALSATVGPRLQKLRVSVCGCFWCVVDGNANTIGRCYEERHALSPKQCWLLWRLWLGLRPGRELELHVAIYATQGRLPGQLLLPRASACND